MVVEKLAVRPPWRTRRKSEKDAPFTGNDEVKKDAGLDTKERSSPQKGRNPQPERLQTSAPDPSASVSDPSVCAPQIMGRQFNQALQKISREKAFAFPKRPDEPLRAELYGGVHWKRIESLIFDMQHSPFEEQVQEAVRTS